MVCREARGGVVQENNYMWDAVFSIVDIMGIFPFPLPDLRIGEGDDQPMEQRGWEGKYCDFKYSGKTQAHRGQYDAAGSTESQWHMNSPSHNQSREYLKKVFDVWPNATIKDSITYHRIGKCIPSEHTDNMIAKLSEKKVETDVWKQGVGKDFIGNPTAESSFAGAVSSRNASLVWENKDYEAVRTCAEFDNDPVGCVSQSLIDDETEVGPTGVDSNGFIVYGNVVVRKAPSMCKWRKGYVTGNGNDPGVPSTCKSILSEELDDLHTKVAINDLKMDGIDESSDKYQQLNAEKEIWEGKITAINAGTHAQCGNTTVGGSPVAGTTPSKNQWRLPKPPPGKNPKQPCLVDAE